MVVVWQMCRITATQLMLVTHNIRYVAAFKLMFVDTLQIIIVSVSRILHCLAGRIFDTLLTEGIIQFLTIANSSKQREECVLLQ